MLAKLLQVLHIKQGELSRLLCLMLFFVLVGFTTVVEPNLAKAIFSSTLGADRLSTALSLGAFVYFFAALGLVTGFIRYSSTKFLLSLFLGFSALSALNAFLSTLGASEAALTFMAVSTKVVAFVLLGLVWVTASWLFPTEAGKRLFPYLSAAMIGGILLGSLTLYLNEGALANWVIFALSSTGLLICSGLIFFIRINFSDHLSADNSDTTLPDFIRYLMRSKYWLIICIVPVLFFSLYFTIDYAFDQLAEKAHPAEADLASFYGLTWMLSGVICMLLMVAISKRLVRKLQVWKSVVFVFALLTILLATLGAEGPIWTAQIAKILAEYAAEFFLFLIVLIYQASHEEFRSSFITFADQLATFGGMAVAAALASLYDNSILSFTQLCWMSAALGLLATLWVRRRQTLYEKALGAAINIQETKELLIIEEPTPDLSELDQEAVVDFLLTSRQLNDADPKKKEAALAKLEKYAALPTNQLLALQLIEAFSLTEQAPFARRLLLADSPHVRRAAIAALVSLEEPAASFKPLMADTDLEVTNALITALEKMPAQELIDLGSHNVFIWNKSVHLALASQADPELLQSSAISSLLRLLENLLSMDELKKIPQSDVIKPLLEHYELENHLILETCLYILTAQENSPAMTESLLRALTDESFAEHEAAVEMLANLVHRSDLAKMLLAYFEGHTVHEQQLALQHFWPDARPQHFSSLLFDETPGLCPLTCYILGLSQDKRYIPLLERITHEGDEFSKQTARAAILKLKGDPMAHANIDPMEMVLFLKNLAPFAQIPAPHVANIAKILHADKYTSEVELAEKDTPTQDLIFVFSGSCDVNGKEAGKFSILGLRSLIEGSPSYYTITARPNTVCLFLSAKNFEHLQEIHPTFTQGLLSSLCDEVKRFG